MINVDISNIWTCVSLPDLLGSEKEVFDAHNLLRSNNPEGPDFLGWLNMPVSVSGRLVHGIRRAAERICADSDILVVCGSGGAYQGARAAIDLYCGSGRNLLGLSPQVVFVGESLSSRQWVELSQLLQDRNYSLHIMSPDGKPMAPNITARGLRWMMERKYGGKTKERISVSTVVGSSLHKMAQEEGYEIFPMPKEMGGISSSLTAGALLPMAVAGIDPLAVLEGAAESWKELDIRSFENPAWLYAAARTILAKQGRTTELFCVFDHNLTALGHWWQRHVWRHECREEACKTVQPLLLPGDLEAIDQTLCAGSSNVFETVLHFSPIAKKVPVEMDWKDYDGLGFLSGRTMDYVEAATMTAMIETHNGAGVPILDVDAGDLTAETLGQLFYFFELSSALSACMSGIDPVALESSQVQQAAVSTMNL